MESVPEVRRAGASAAARPVGGRASGATVPRGAASHDTARTEPQQAHARFADGVARALTALDVDAAGASPAERIDALLRALGSLGRGDAPSTLGERLAALALDARSAGVLASGAAEARGGAFARQLVLLASAAHSHNGGAAAFEQLAARLAESAQLSVHEVTTALATVARSAGNSVASALGGSGAAAWWVAARSSVDAALGTSFAQGSTPAQQGSLLRALIAVSVDGEANALAGRVLDVAGAMGEALATEARLLFEAAERSGARQAIERFVGSAEFEQAWSAARREGGDTPVWSFAVADGHGGHTTVHVAHEREGGGRDEAEAAALHLTVGVEFSALGPVRADVVLRAERVALRLVAAEPVTAQALRLRSAELEALLGFGGRDVLLVIADGTRAQATVGAGGVVSASEQPTDPTADGLMDAWG